MADTRNPKQKRSIEKRERLIKAANQVFAEKGYYNINTVDIVNAAGLSVGVFYSYFTDKKDILLTCLDKYGVQLSERICNEINLLPASDDIEDVLIRMITVFADFHSQKQLYHSEVKALSYLDEDVDAHLKKLKKATTDSFSEKLSSIGYSFTYEEEQVYLIFRMIEGIEEALMGSTILNRNRLINQCAHTIKEMLVKDDLSS